MTMFDIPIIQEADGHRTFFVFTFHLFSLVDF